jgi:hypothetical protein
MESSDYIGLFYTGFFSGYGGGMLLKSWVLSQKPRCGLDKWFAGITSIFFILLSLLFFFLAFYWEVFKSSALQSIVAGMAISLIVSGAGYIAGTSYSRSGNKVL